MLSQIQLEEMTFDELKELVRASELTIPKHASKDDLIDLMTQHYITRRDEIIAKNAAEDDKALTGGTEAKEPVVESRSKEKPKGFYSGYDTRQEYITAMLTPVLCIITPQSPEFSRQTSPSASISVGNALITNREFTFIADGQSVTSVPRIALARIKSMKLLMRGNNKLNKQTMTGNLQGSGFGHRFRVHELTELEIEDYKSQKKASNVAAQGVGL